MCSDKTKEKRQALVQALIGGMAKVTYPPQAEGEFMQPQVKIGEYTMLQVAEVVEAAMEENNGLYDELRELKLALERAEEINRELRKTLDG